MQVLIDVTLHYRIFHVCLCLPSQAVIDVLKFYTDQEKDEKFLMTLNKQKGVY